MGTINYKTSDFITLGYNCNYIDYDDEFYNDDIQDLFDQLQDQLKKERFYYFHIAIEPGYYEGYFLDIEFNYSVCFDGWEDRKEAQKEITQIKAFLLNCSNNFECCAVSPGWCTSYYDYKDTLNKLNAAIKEMRQTVQFTPTYTQYIKEGA